MTVEDVVAVNVGKRFFLTGGGAVCKIENLIDDEGSFTEDMSRARCAVGQLPSGKWTCIDLSAFAHVTLH
jgi:hypothetical protein